MTVGQSCGCSFDNLSAGHRQTWKMTFGLWLSIESDHDSCSGCGKVNHLLLTPVLSRTTLTWTIRTQLNFIPRLKPSTVLENFFERL